MRSRWAAGANGLPSSSDGRNRGRRRAEPRTNGGSNRQSRSDQDFDFKQRPRALPPRRAARKTDGRTSVASALLSQARTALSLEMMTGPCAGGSIRQATLRSNIVLSLFLQEPSVEADDDGADELILIL